MRKHIILSAASSVALLLSAQASAAPALTGYATATYDSTNGVVTVTCAAPPCHTLASGKGFAQVQDSLGRIITYNIAAGFESADVVHPGAGNGVFGIQNITAASADQGNFGSSATIKTGWAHPQPGHSEVNINLTLDKDGTNKENGFISNFSVSSLSTDGGKTNSISSLMADQVVFLNDVSGASKQHFRTQIEKAATAQSGFKFNNASGSVQGTDTGVTYAMGDMIQAVWVGQQIADQPDFGTQSLSKINPDGSAVNTTGVTNLSTTGPFEWGEGSVMKQEFGDAPTF